jgi:hypothetical protein
MRKYAQGRLNGNKDTALNIGTIVRVKVDKVDCGKLDHKSIPRVIMEVMQHDNYRIACKGGVLKDCLGAQRFQVEPIKKAEHSVLEEAYSNWNFMQQMSIRESLTYISKIGGQGNFFCNCKGKCDKNTCKCKKMVRSATASVTQETHAVLTTFNT